jgi:hypothetical protein
MWPRFPHYGEARKAHGCPVRDFLQTIHSWNDLDNVITLITLAKRLDIAEVQGLLQERQFTLPQRVALGLALPIHPGNDALYQLLVQTVSQPGICPLKFRLTLSIRLVRCVILRRCPDDLLATGVLQILYEEDRFFQYPLLMLSAHCSAPLPFDPVMTRDHRLNTISFYYGGWLKLFLRDFEGADWCFRRAWFLSRSGKSVRPSIVHGMSLSAFLARCSRAAFEARIPAKYLPRKGAARDVWNLDGIPIYGWPREYERLRYEISREFTRRALLDLARSVTLLPIADACLICCADSPDSLIAVLFDQTELKAVIENDTIVLSEPALTPNVDREIELLSNEMGHFSAFPHASSA